MNGIENYQEAERLAAAYKEAITAAEAMPADTPRAAEERYFAAENARGLLAKAAVHARLAQAAATVLNPEDTEARVAWQQITRVPRPECAREGCTNERSVSFGEFCFTHRDTES